MGIKKKTIALLRVSSDQQDFQSQKQGIIDYCKNNKIVIDEWIEEFDVSGYSTKLEDRDGLQQIKRMAINQEMDKLIVFNQDRIGRSTDLLQYIITLNQLGVEIISTMDGTIDAIDLNSQFMSYVKLWMSEQESVKTSNRVKNGILAKNKKNLLAAGKPPYGYRVENSKLIVIEEEAIIIREAFELAQYYGGYKICEILNEKGLLKRGKKWTYSPLSYMLSNHVYKGFARYNLFHSCNPKDKTDKARKKDLCQMKLQDHDPMLQIVPTELWDRVQIATKDRLKGKGNTSKSSLNTDQLLEGLLYHKCWDGHEQKMNIGYNYHKCNEKNTPMFLCARCKRVKPKDIKIKKTIVATSITKIFEEKIELLISNLDLDLLREELLSKSETDVVESKKKLTLLEKDLKKKNTALSKAATELEKIFLGESDMNTNVINTLINKLEREISTLEKEIYDTKSKIVEKCTCRISVNELLCRYKNFKDIYASATLEDKKKILSELIDRVVWEPNINGLEIRLRQLI